MAMGEMNSEAMNAFHIEGLKLCSLVLYSPTWTCPEQSLPVAGGGLCWPAKGLAQTRTPASAAELNFSSVFLTQK
jgi:hypothetical protein